MIKKTFQLQAMVERNKRIFYGGSDEQTPKPVSRQVNIDVEFAQTNKFSNYTLIHDEIKSSTNDKRDAKTGNRISFNSDLDPV